MALDRLEAKCLAMSGDVSEVSVHEWWGQDLSLGQLTGAQSPAARL